MVDFLKILKIFMAVLEHAKKYIFIDGLNLE